MAEKGERKRGGGAATAGLQLVTLDGDDDDDGRLG